MFKKGIMLLYGLFLSIQGLLAQDVLDKIVAIVDDNIILKSELEQFSYSFAIQSGIEPAKEPDEFQEILKQTMDNMIVQKVLLVKAKQDSVTVSDQQIDAVLEDQIKQMVQQLGSESRVEDYFGTSLRKIRREFREEVEERLLVQKLRETKSFETQISRREVEDFYQTYRDSLPVLKESVKISHILVHVEPSKSAVDAAKKKAERVLARVRKGEDFGELARQFSEGPSAPKGGDLGLTSRGDMVREFEEVAFSLEPGQISDIVQTKFGLHIIQLLRKVGEKINARHILFRLDTSPDDEKATVKKLQELRQQILAGEISFAEAAEKYSKDEETATKGGDLGWFEVGQFQIESFKDAVAGLKIGEISKPEKTRFGYHLIRVDDRRPERKLRIDKDWEQIESWALDLKRRKQFEIYVGDAKKDVYIEIKGL